MILECSLFSDICFNRLQIPFRSTFNSSIFLLQVLGVTIFPVLEISSNREASCLCLYAICISQFYSCISEVLFSAPQKSENVEGNLKSIIGKKLHRHLNFKVVSTIKTVQNNPAN